MSFLVNSFSVSPSETTAVITYQNRISGGGGTTNVINIGSNTLGTASPDRWIFASANFSCNSDVTISSAAINGVTARVNASAIVNYSGTRYHTVLVSALVPSGTFGAVSLTLSASTTFTIPYSATWRVTGLTTNVEEDTALGTSSSTATSQVLNIDITKGGILIDAGLIVPGNTGFYSYTGCNEDYEAPSSTVRPVGGSYVATATETNRAVTLTGSVAFRGPRILASFK